VKRDSADEFARLDFLFHASIVKAAQNRFFQEYRLLLYTVLVIVILIVRPMVSCRAGSARCTRTTAYDSALII
jgi:DNA-binding FadR family transcriptional regulator